MKDVTLTLQLVGGGARVGHQTDASARQLGRRTTRNERHRHAAKIRGRHEAAAHSVTPYIVAFHSLLRVSTVKLDA